MCATQLKGTLTKAVIAEVENILPKACSETKVGEVDGMTGVGRGEEGSSRPAWRILTELYTAGCVVGCESMPLMSEPCDTLSSVT